MAKAKPIDGLDRELAYGHAAALVVRVRAGEMLEHSHGVLDVDAIERVHDMRVASRRLRAALEIFAPCFERHARKRVLAEVKAIADALGERRDRDVAIATLGAYSSSVARADRPGLESMIATLRAEQDAANEDLAGFVEPSRLQALAAQVEDLTAAASAPVP